MELKLNIYSKDNKKTPAKTHVANSYELMLGTVEDLMNIVDPDKVNDNKELAVMVVKGYKQLKPLLFDIFEDLTEEDLKHIKVKELIPLFADIINCILEDLDILKEGN